ncbi:MAG: N-acetylmuramoyl-L-alanine amidase [Deltaproteobacteria bacterium]|nr:N-acetylmuramoyl-L-alanine amidase [Deltaproteobacteria bacterium]
MGKDVDDLLDLAALLGVGALRPLVAGLSPRERADLRDLWTLGRCGDSGYLDPSLPGAPPTTPRRRRRAMGPPMLGEAVYGTTYSSRPGAVARGRQLQQTHMAIKLVQNAVSKEWEVHYDEPVPTRRVPFDDTKTFATKVAAVPRARLLRAYGYGVAVLKPAGKDAYCRVTRLTGSVGLPTTTGPDAGFVYPSFGRADIRANALREAGFGATPKQIAPAKFQVEITSLPTFGATATGATSSTRYTVKRGDSLYGIATAHGLTVDELKQANRMTSDTIRPGDVLVVARKAAPPKAAPPAPPKAAPPAPKPAPPKPAPTVASPAPSSAGHDPGGDWSSGVVRTDSPVRKADRVTQQRSGDALLFFRKGASVRRTGAAGAWLEVEGPVHGKEPGKAAVAAGTGKGWIERDATSMTLGVFKDLPVDDRTEKYGALTTGSFFGAREPTKIVVHQTQSQTGVSTLDVYKDRIAKRSTRGSHYLIDENGVVILVVPVSKVVSHATGHNSTSIGIEHVGMPAALAIPSSTADTTTLTTLRTRIAAMTMSPRLHARIAAMTDAQLVRFAKDSREPGMTKWYLYGDLNGRQKRASYLLVEKLQAHFSIARANVYAHEALVAKSPGEGENIIEYLTARSAYPASVARLAELVARDPALAADAVLAKIVGAETATVAALKLDGTAAETAAVASKDAAATLRESVRGAFYARFWLRSTQLDALVTLLGTAGSSTSPGLATATRTWVF